MEGIRFGHVGLIKTAKAGKEMMCRAGNRDASGVSLLELLVVMAIIAVILGTSSAFFTRMNRGLVLNSAEAQLEVSLRSARHFALKEGVMSEVEIDPNARVIRVLGTKTVGLWHFETIDKKSVTPGALKRDAQVFKVNSVEGKIGKGFEFQGDSKVDCGLTQAYPLANGFIVEMWILTQTVGKQTIFEVDGFCKLSLDNNNTLVAQCGGLEIKAPNLNMPVYRWFHIIMSYSKDGFCIYVNHILEAYSSVPYLFINKSQKPIYIGSSFRGKIDEVKLSIPLELFTYTLPPKVKFGKIDNSAFAAQGNITNSGTVITPGGESQQHCQSVIFDSQGRLDPARHSSPVSIEIISDSLKKNVYCKIGLMGYIYH